MTEVSEARPRVPGVEAASPPTISPRHVAAAVIGNWLEFYDFTVYAYFAIQIGDAFFPGKSAFIRLMASLLTYGAGFVCRPIGAIVIGRYADRVGRRPAMLLSFAMMGVALVALACIPTYSQIGVAAPVLVVICRLVQGFALGGEVGPTTAYLIEAAPAGKRGLYGAWQSASQSLSSISGGFVGVVLAGALGASDLKAWGWRIAFLVGALVLPFGFAIRRSLPETRHQVEDRLASHPEVSPDARLRQVILAHWRIILLGLGLITGSTVSTYVFTYMTTYVQVTLHMGIGIAFWVTVCNGLAGLAASLAAGWLSDRFGRRPLMIWPRLAFLLATMPVFILVIRNREPVAMLAMMAGLNVLANLSSVAALVAITESLRKEIRSVVMATVYATAVAVFGGTTQPIVAWLGHVTHDPLAVAWYMLVATLVALGSALLMVETVRKPVN